MAKKKKKKEMPEGVEIWAIGREAEKGDYPIVTIAVEPHPSGRGFVRAVQVFPTQEWAFRHIDAMTFEPALVLGPRRGPKPKR